MSEKRFTFYYERGNEVVIEDNGKRLSNKKVVDLLNEQQEFIEELQVSDEMGWKRAEHFEKKCPKELHNKKMYIKRLEYKVQKFKEMNNEQQATIKQLQDKLFAMQHTIDNQENAIFHLKDTDDNLRKKNIRIEELSKVVHNLKMVLSSDDEQVAKIVGEQQATISALKEENIELKKLRKYCAEWMGVKEENLYDVVR